MLVYLPNRGRRAVLAVFQGASAAEPAGDGFLFRRGYAVAELGWQADARAEADTLRLEAPIARDAGGPLRGLVRTDFMAVERAFHWPLGDLRGHVAGTELRGFLGGLGYAADDPAARDHALTVRDSPDGERRPVPREAWQHARLVGGKLVEDPGYVHLRGGFEPGKFYELVFRARDPRVVGLGFVALRDFASHVKHAPDALARVDRVHAFGISQCGRFLRHFLYEGWNADEQGRRALDGVMPDVAGAGRGGFNHRFAQPSRDVQPVAARLHPVDLFPFTDLPQRDPETGRAAGLLDRTVAARVVPKIFHVNTSNEYWGRAAALIHTSADGKTDVRIPADVRVYALAGLQHTNGTFPPSTRDASSGAGVHVQGIIEKRWVFRALLAALDAWVKRGRPPPPSQYPRLGDRTLVPPERLAFPKIPGVSVPARPQRVLRLDYGPRFADGIVEREPPREVGPPYPVLVPQVDRDGNELGGVRLPEGRPARHSHGLEPPRSRHRRRRRTPRLRGRLSAVPAHRRGPRERRRPAPVDRRALPRPRRLPAPLRGRGARPRPPGLPARRGHPGDRPPRRRAVGSGGGPRAPGEVTRGARAPGGPGAFANPEGCTGRIIKWMARSPTHRAHRGMGPWLWPPRTCARAACTRPSPPPWRLGRPAPPATP
jgi:hypothetical protein